MKKLLQSCLALLLLLFVTGNYVFAQISEGGIPPSFTYSDENATKRTKGSFSADIFFDVIKLRAEDKMNEENGLPLRTAIVIPSKLNLSEAGYWTTLTNGQKVLKLTLKAPDAIAMMLYYDEFYIPDGGKLFIYNQDQTHVLGAYTHKTNPKGKSFANEFISGNELTLEYVSPSNEESAPRIIISGIGYGYNHLEVYDKGNKPRAKSETSGSCMVNVNCEEGNNWQNQKRGIVKSVAIINGNIYTCSGAIINNTSQDLTPYLLTAHHCFYINGVECSNYDQIVYYFDFEHPDCENLSVEPSTTKTLIGAQKLVDIPIDGGSDGFLLRLLDNIPENYNVYYNGWDRNNTAPSSGVTIHHPAGDVKKISTFSAEATSATWNGTTDDIGAENAHWNVSFVATTNGFGVTEGGSSGAPLFNQDGRIVGTLSGGSSTCTDPTGGRNLFGKFWYHWNQSPSPEQQLVEYLDPLNTGLLTLDGTYFVGGEPKADFIASSTEIYALQFVTYTNTSSNATTYEWTFEGGEPRSSTEKNPPIITYNAAGNFVTKMIINKGENNEKVKELTIIVTEKGGNPVIPEAKLAFGETLLFSENFDVASSTEFPPAGWSVEQKVEGSTHQWIADNLKTANFNSIDSNSTYSALIKYKTTNTDAWLKSGQIAIPENAQLEFYAGYARYYVRSAFLALHISTDGGTTWEDKWTNAEDYAAETFAWHKQVIDLSEYGGTDIMLAWQYSGRYGDTNAIDGVRITSPDDQPVTIKVGDIISLTDLSTGPPVLWDWTFEGGIPETSQAEKPSVQYMAPGVYDISLKVKNTKGENTFIFENAVTVEDVVPVANFEANKGYIRQSDYGPYIPTGTTVNFGDKSINYPVAWNWVFEGATPSASNIQNPEEIVYDTAGEHKLSFIVSNTAGEDTINTMVRVGYDAERIWNMEYGEPGTSVITTDHGYITGTNTHSITAYAEKFDEPITTVGVVSEVDILFHVEDVTSNGTLKVSIAKLGAGVGSPGDLIQTVDLSIQDINPNGYTTVTFAEPVMIDGAFFVVVDGFYTSSYKLAIKSSVINKGENTTYVYSNGWSSIGGIYVYTAMSLNIVPKFAYGKMNVTGEKIIHKANVEENEGVISIKSNVEWNVQSTDLWINILNGTQKGDGSFSFSVSENKGYPRNGLIVVSAGNKVKEYIVVSQAGPSPKNIDVEPIEEAGLIKINWEAPEFEVPEFENIFDGAENHTDFAINSAGSLGWTYIDADGANTWGFYGASFPNESEPSAFRVYNPSQVTGGSQITPYSGEKCFASFGSVNNNTNDWMISPELFFKEDFKFSFWAKAYSPDYTERIRIAYSTTNNKGAGLIHMLAPEPSVELSSEWVKFEYTVPTNAKYVGINNISEDGFVLFVDDIYIGTGDETENLSSKSLSISNTSNNNMLKRIRKTNDNKDEYNSFIANKFETVSINTEATVPVITSFEEDEDRYLVDLRWDNGINYTRIGKRDGGKIEVAIYFIPTDLVAFHGAMIEEVDLFLWTVPTNGITLKIRQGGEVIHSQQVNASNLKVQEYTRIKLSDKIFIDASKDLHLGYEYIQEPGIDNYVPGCDRGPALVGKGDLISENGGSFFSLGARNWNIAMLVQDVRNDNFDFSYVIYRDGATLTKTDSQTYTDSPDNSGNIEYSVIAKYNDQIESDRSNHLSVFMPAAVTNLNGNGGVGLANLSWDTSQNAASYNIYRDEESIAKGVTGTNYEDTDLQAGEYCYKVVAVSSIGIVSQFSETKCINVRENIGIDTDDKDVQTAYIEKDILFLNNCQGYSFQLLSVDGRLIDNIEVNEIYAAYPVDILSGMYILYGNNRKDTLIFKLLVK